MAKSKKSCGIDDLVKKTASLDIRKPDNYYGLQGLLPDSVLYRACEKTPHGDIVCKDPNSDRTVEQHIASGSRKPSRFISTTTSSEVVKKWKNDNQPIVVIYLSKMAGMKELDEMINLTNKEVREHFIKGAIHRNRAISSQEVLFQFRIPKKNGKGENVFELWMA